MEESAAFCWLLYFLCTSDVQHRRAHSERMRIVRINRVCVDVEWSDGRLNPFFADGRLKI